MCFRSFLLKSSLLTIISMGIAIPYALAIPSHCPSSASFFHNEGQNWAWRQSYPMWSIESDGSNANPLKSLPSTNFDLDVLVAPSFKLVICHYGSEKQRSNNQLGAFSVVSNSPVSTIGKKLPPNFSALNDDKSDNQVVFYRCKTQASTPKQCSWTLSY